MDTICARELGKDWDSIAAALNKPARMVIRANTLKTTREKLQATLIEDGVETEMLSLAPDALELVFRRNVFRYNAFTDGMFEVQDAASQLVSDFLDAQPGMRVVDACAGSGGKTLHLGAIMKNKGKIIALDNKDFKLAELRKRASRAGVSIIEAKVVDNTKVIKRLAGSADRVLLDMPCSGLGVLRRNPDSKWLFLEEELERVKEQQQQLLTLYATMCKPGGFIVYAVCSILPSEGEKQVQQFIATNSAYELVGEKRYSPADYDCDGFYMAKIIRKE
jgi:16S rRNA (cytosine967-C5)-methyltransferase